MTNNIILIALAVIFALVLFLLVEIYRLRRKFRESEIDAIQQVNLTIKSLDTEVQQLKKDLYDTVDKKK
ncbi:MAG: hypothetical protein PF489_05725 [Salinivirgaceae bacterium]|jgi:YbbR domain-containing protein|nr:hypothetical protein [Salinivirgaceae bacterium]